MARKKKRNAHASQRSPRRPEFRGKVEAEVVDRLLYRFVVLVKRGLELMLHTPSELANEEFRRNPELTYTAEQIPVLLLWAAVGAYELPWSEFCQHVLTHPAWAELLEVQTQDDLDHLSTGFDHCPVRLVELAVHDGLKEGDKQDQRPPQQKPPVRDEFAEFIGASRVLKLLKKRLRPFL